MRDSSYKSSKTTLQIPFQGGEKKVMKKSLSLLLALAMVFGMFASMASAATDSDLTTAQKYQQLVDKGILKGTTDGLPHLEDNLNRAQFATIAVAVAGLDVPAATTSAFSDVTVGQWWTNAIQAAYAAGYVNGTGAGKFEPKANVTVESVIKVATAIAKLTPVEGATVEGSSAWAGPYIQAAINAGLPIPSNYKAAATRGQTVDIAYAVFASLQVKPLTDVKAVVNADDTITVTGKTVGADAVKVAVGTAAAAAATLKEDGTFSFTTTKQAVGTYTLTVTAYKGEASLASAEVSATIDGFKVDSVKVLNGKQIAVTFNKAVKEGTTEGAFKYDDYNYGTTSSPDYGYYFTLAGAQPSSTQAPALSDDKKTVTLTFEHFKAFNSGAKDLTDTYQNFLIVSGLKSASGQDLGEVKQAIYLTDSTAPSVKSISYSGFDATIEFSEPLSDIGSVSIDGVEINDTASASNLYYATTPDADGSGDFTKIKIKNLSVDTAAELDIVGATDIAGNYLDYNGTLKVPSDDALPSVTSLTVNGSNVVVKFSEALLNEQAVLTVVDGGTYDSSVAAQGSYDSDTNTATFKLKPELGVRTFASVQVYFAAGDFTDLQNNDNKATAKQTITLNADKTNPTFKSVTTDGAHILLKYSEAVELAAADLGTLSFKYTDDNGVVTNADLAYTAVEGYDINDDGDKDDTDEANYIDLTVTGPSSILSGSVLAAGKYSFTIASGAVVDSWTNPAAKTSVSFTVSGASAKNNVELVSVFQVNKDNATSYASYDVNNNIIYFEFDHKLNKSQLVASNFLLTGAALPAGTNFYFIDTDRTIVAAEVPAGTIASNGSRNFSVKNIVADNGDTLNTSKATAKGVALIENKAPTVVSATFADDQTIVVTFSEVVKLAGSSDDALGELTININGTDYTYASTATASADGTTKTVTIDTDKADTFKAGQTVKITVGGSSITDANDNAVASGSVTVK
ncbi:S-layer homology domain-containing protein [Cohnella sp. AR92]|uniref:S-layer homology domain-containing protein n=1 Tax=Cohnella sp. AR92 TaxID=648716 RepID=UPI000F8EF69B|nr:S-layer homology domain-containing protein [Cohnella sp. AR92]RUS49205.1 S-layer homology domain-containing protein [Cohnella sp. AR92]